MRTSFEIQCGEVHCEECQRLLRFAFKSKGPAGRCRVFGDLAKGEEDNSFVRHPDCVLGECDKATPSVAEQTAAEEYAQEVASKVRQDLERGASDLWVREGEDVDLSYISLAVEEAYKQAVDEYLAQNEGASHKAGYVPERLTDLSSAQLRSLAARAEKMADDLEADQPTYEMAIEAGVSDWSGESPSGGHIASYEGEAEITMKDGSKWRCVGHGTVGDAEHIEEDGYIEFFCLSGFPGR